jgi:UDP-N-acetylglucosamine--N-acetylmuramyl-(pentapeptide) pyrophosphoryl-undecaprenol N-acetylglucosamine transferase
VTIVLTGGGSGGHITPILAVASELKQRRPDIELVYIGQKGDSLGDIPLHDPNIDHVYTVRAGKFRRYHSEGLKQLLDFPTIYKNMRDLIYVFIGLFQSRKIIKKIKPSMVFSRGGYVSVPVALGAKLNHVPYVTHDSDPIPSLANRIIAPWAELHLVALPKEIYKYPQSKTITTGIPLSKNFVPMTTNLQKSYRQKLNIDQDSRLLLVIGGGLGAQSLNLALLEILPNLLHEFKDLTVSHIVGRANDEVMKQKYSEVLSEDQVNRVIVLDHISNVYLYSGAADLIITRAGATNLAEFAVQGKACIVVPSSFLVAGHQLRNAEYLEEKQAAVVVTDREVETDPNRLAKQISRLLKDNTELLALGKGIAKFSKPNSTAEITDIILNLVDKKL